MRLREVLITRPAGAAVLTAAHLEARGFRSVLAPVLTIASLSADLPPPTDLQAVLVTSARALPALAGHRQLRLLAVGASTAAAAGRAGHALVESAAGDAEALARLTITRCMPAKGRLLLVSGEGQGAPLAQALCQAGFTVVHRVVYAARPVADLPEPACLALRRGTLYAATFFSAETARVFAGLAERAGLRDTVAPVVALAIGGPAAAALAVLPWRCVRVASRPTQDELLALL